MHRILRCCECSLLISEQLGSRLLLHFKNMFGKMLNLQKKTYFLKLCNMTLVQRPLSGTIRVSMYQKVQNVSILDLLELRMTEMVVTTGATGRAKFRSKHHHQQTNTFLSPNQWCYSTEGKLSDTLVH